MPIYNKKSLSIQYSGYTAAKDQDSARTIEELPCSLVCQGMTMHRRTFYLLFETGSKATEAGIGQLFLITWTILVRFLRRRFLRLHKQVVLHKHSKEIHPFQPTYLAKEQEIF